MNTTASEKFEIDLLQVVTNSADIITGSLSAISNFVILILFTFSKPLHRKELLILYGLAMGDCIYGLGCFVGGIERLQLVYKNTQFTMVSPWSCQMKLATFCYIFGPKLTALMNITISIDRLISIRWCHHYLKFGIKYVVVLTGCVVSFAMVSYLVGLVLSATMPSTPTALALCFSTQASWPSYGTCYTMLIAVCNCSSVGVYCFVMGILKYRVKHASVAMQDIQQKRQNKVTKMVGIMVLADFFLDVVPFIIQTSISASNVSESIVEIVLPVTWIFVPINRTVRVVIYIWKVKDIRKGVLDLFRCRLKKNQVSFVKIGSTSRQQQTNPVNQRTTTL